MSKVEDIKNELKLLLNYAGKLSVALSPQKGSMNNESSDLKFFVHNYELWYSKALNVVSNLLPDRVNDFILLYKNEKRKVIDISTYTISDALRTLTKKGVFSPATASFNLLQQRNILQACLEKFDSKIYDIQTILQADIFDSEIDSAKHLLKNGFIRAAGAICGVILEKHLIKVCINHNVKLTKKDPTISVLNENLKEVAYDTIEWRRMQRLGDLRNLCDHNKDREPTTEEVEELILGTDRVIKTIL